ncbi:acyl-CoA thioesterase [Demequina sp. TTPB684]|uniref:acyl-CoA thioesterase n=1 Tax=unclassified Demequina TaxID=2620311 RepID=UPI001CF5A8A5|nr:thioesterase family protein [Demequina sp. TMPB413]MCB2411573.1 acyl-CoA thioesterase [Demequina sp. TTPB684]UPU87199.1 acyl-CoA thioesterase [Demequina sp. TMPB413]
MPAIRVPLHLRWSDVDAYGHVNNAAIVGLLEEARVQAFWRDDDPILPPLTSTSDAWVLVAEVHVKYRRVIDHRTEPIEAEVSIIKCAGASFVIAYRLLVDGLECVTASTTMALVDGATGLPTRIGPELRAGLLEFSS